MNRPNPSKLLYSTLRQNGVDCFVSVPCKLLDGLIKLLEKSDDIIYTPVTREEEGIGVMAGAFLAGRRPAIIMQNSGFGNSVNATQSLLNYYRIPVVFVISHRGSKGEPIDAQRNMGGIIGDLLELNGIDVLDIGSVNELEKINTAIENAFDKRKSVALLLPFSFWTV